MDKQTIKKLIEGDYKLFYAEDMYFKDIIDKILNDSENEETVVSCIKALCDVIYNLEKELEQ